MIQFLVVRKTDLLKLSETVSKFCFPKCFMTSEHNQLYKDFGV